MQEFIKKYFLTFAIAILILGAVLRINNYQEHPVLDEYDFAWIGITLINNHQPTGWSWLESYGPRNKSITWTSEGYKESPLIMWENNGYRLVTPDIEHPPLWSIIQGVFLKTVNISEMFDITVEKMRILPLVLSLFTLLFLMLLAKIWFGEERALLTGLFYATIPVMVISNRWAMPENFITLLLLISFSLYEHYKKTEKRYNIIIIGVLAGLASLAKVPGLAVAAIMIAFLFIDNNKNKNRNILIISTLTFLFFSLYLVYGFYLNAELFKKVLSEQGSRIFITSLFAKIILEPKLVEKIVNDGWFITSIFAFFYAIFKKQKQIIIPISISLLVLGFFFSGATLRSWYLIPIYPFLAMALAYFFITAVKEKAYLLTLFIAAILIPSLFDLTTTPINIWLWRITLLAFTLLGMLYLKNAEQQEKIMIFFTYIILIIAVIMNIYILLHQGLL